VELEKSTYFSMAIIHRMVLSAAYTQLNTSYIVHIDGKPQTLKHKEVG